MHFEETSQTGALISAGDLLSHIHIASLKNRMVPGMDGDADRYVDGFPKGAPAETRTALIRDMCKILRDQWAEA